LLNIVKKLTKALKMREKKINISKKVRNLCSNEKNELNRSEISGPKVLFYL
jgi:hypothetical protein